MMRGVAAIIFHVLVTQTHAKSLATQLFDPVQGSMDNLVDRLFEKAFEVNPLHHADLDDTTLGKTGHLAQHGHLGLSQQASIVASPATHLSRPSSVPFFSFKPSPGRQTPAMQSPVLQLPRHVSARAGQFADHPRPHIARSTATAEAGTSETYKFEAEVGRIMDIIVNSIYSDRDVFLRELISNSADAMEKKRFMQIADNRGAGIPERIMVRSDKNSTTLYVEDNGVGMTKQELIDNLGRIAASGTKRFTEMMAKSKDDVSLIGQFGVGFYSSFLVADQVTVTTCSFNQTGNELYQWKSVPGDFGNFKINPVAEFPDIGATPSLLRGGSGTQIALTLKKDAKEYLDPYNLNRLLKKFSEFISFPINLWSEKTEYIQVPDGNKTNADGSVKMKSQPKQIMDWELMNKMKPLWLRDPLNINQSEYTEFYKTTFRAFDEPLGAIHFSAEGQIEFRALMYFPKELPFEFNRDMFGNAGRAVRLYVRRVFINDKFEDIVPRWLIFMRGVVDSEDLPLNVGREILQKSKTLSIIRKRIVRKVLDFMEQTAKNDPAKFNKMWDNYGRYFKVGLIEDADNKEALKKVVRFFSSKTGDNTTSLADYVSRMQKSQEKIYFCTGDGRKSASMAPTMEKMNAKGLEVLYLVDPLDEIAMQDIGKFEGKSFLDINKGKLDLDVSDEEKKEANVTQSEFSPLLKWYATTLGTGKVQEVKLSDRLTDSPAVLVQAEWGMSPTMQRYVRAQASAKGEDDKMSQMNFMNQAILEINPDQPIVQKLKEAFTADKNAQRTKDLANMIFEIAALTGGYRLDDPTAFAQRVTTLVTAGVSGGSSVSRAKDAEIIEPKPAPAPASKPAPAPAPASASASVPAPAPKPVPPKPAEPEIVDAKPSGSSKPSDSSKPKDAEVIEAKPE